MLFILLVLSGHSEWEMMLGEFSLSSDCMFRSVLIRASSGVFFCCCCCCWLVWWNDCSPFARRLHGDATVHRLLKNIAMGTFQELCSHLPLEFECLKETIFFLSFFPALTVFVATRDERGQGGKKYSCLGFVTTWASVWDPLSLNQCFHFLMNCCLLQI